MKPTTTLNYYNNNAIDFVTTTRNVDFTTIQKAFTKHLPPAATILDFGCGSGRDTRYFLDQGFLVNAIDGSSELCKLATEYTGIEVTCMQFQDIEVLNRYNGIWACSSILHLPIEELKIVFIKLAAALKRNGIVYTSFKYGDFEGYRDDRYFIDMTEEKFINLLDEIQVFDMEKIWITSDVRPGRDDEKWLNVIVRKKN